MGCWSSAEYSPLTPSSLVRLKKLSLPIVMSGSTVCGAQYCKSTINLLVYLGMMYALPRHREDAIWRIIFLGDGIPPSLSFQSFDVSNTLPASVTISKGRSAIAFAVMLLAFASQGR